jgi:hypothetical protein
MAFFCVYFKELNCYENPKSEARNSKQSPMTKIQMPKRESLGVPFFFFSKFEFGVCFVLRISIFEFAPGKRFLRARSF